MLPTPSSRRPTLPSVRGPRPVPNGSGGNSTNSVTVTLRTCSPPCWPSLETCSRQRRSPSSLPDRATSPGARTRSSTPPSPALATASAAAWSKVPTNTSSRLGSKAPECSGRQRASTPCSPCAVLTAAVAGQSPGPPSPLAYIASDGTHGARLHPARNLQHSQPLPLPASRAQPQTPSSTSMANQPTPIPTNGTQPAAQNDDVHPQPTGNWRVIPVGCTLTAPFDP